MQTSHPVPHHQEATPYPEETLQFLARLWVQTRVRPRATRIHLAPAMMRRIEISKSMWKGRWRGENRT